MFRLEFAVFVMLRSVYGGSCRNMFFSKVTQEVVMSFRMAGVALCNIPSVSDGMRVHDPRGRKVAVTLGEAGQRYLFHGVTHTVVAWQGWHFVTFPAFQKACVCARDRRGRRVAMSMGEAAETCLFSRCHKKL